MKQTVQEQVVRHFNRSQKLSTGDMSASMNNKIAMATFQSDSVHSFTLLLKYLTVCVYWLLCLFSIAVTQQFPDICLHIYEVIFGADHGSLLPCHGISIFCLCNFTFFPGSNHQCRFNILNERMKSSFKSIAKPS